MAKRKRKKGERPDERIKKQGKRIAHLEAHRLGNDEADYLQAIADNFEDVGDADHAYLMTMIKKIRKGNE